VYLLFIYLLTNRSLIFIYIAWAPSLPGLPLPPTVVYFSYYKKPNILTSCLSFIHLMAQHVARDVLILGDSNVRRYLGRCGGAYTQACDCGLARNMSEFGSSLRMVEANNYRIVIFAMMTNVVIDAGSEGQDHHSRIHAVDECLSPLVENLRSVLTAAYVSNCLAYT